MKKYNMSERERGFILGIILNTKNDYLKKYKYSKIQYVELEDDSIIESNENVESIVEENFDATLLPNNLEKIFRDKKLSKIVKALTEEQRSVLFWFIKGKNDKEIAKELNKNMHAINKMKNRTFSKIKNKYEEDA